MTTFKNNNELQTFLQQKKWAKVQRHLAKPILGKESTKIMEDEYGDLPLHQAIRQDAPDNIIELLLTIYPNAIYHPNKYQWLPIHVASASYTNIKNGGGGISFRIIELLIRHYPQSLEKQTDKGQTPRDLALEMKYKNNGEWALNYRVVQAILKPSSYWINVVNLEKQQQQQQQQQHALKEKDEEEQEQEEEQKKKNTIIQEKVKYNIISELERKQRVRSQSSSHKDEEEEEEEELENVKNAVRHFITKSEKLQLQSEKHIQDLMEQNNELKIRLSESEDKLFFLTNQVVVTHNEKKDKDKENENENENEWYNGVMTTHTLESSDCENVLMMDDKYVDDDYDDESSQQQSNNDEVVVVSMVTPPKRKRTIDEIMMMDNNIHDERMKAIEQRLDAIENRVFFT